MPRHEAIPFNLDIPKVFSVLDRSRISHFYGKWSVLKKANDEENRYKELAVPWYFQHFHNKNF